MTRVEAPRLPVEDATVRASLAEFAEEIRGESRRFGESLASVHAQLKEEIGKQTEELRRFEEALSRVEAPTLPAEDATVRASLVALEASLESVQAQLKEEV